MVPARTGTGDSLNGSYDGVLVCRRRITDALSAAGVLRLVDGVFRGMRVRADWYRTQGLQTKTIRIGCPWPYSVRGVYRRRPNPAAIAFHSTNRKFRRLSFIATNNPNREISIPSVVSAPTRKTPTSRSVSRENT